MNNKASNPDNREFKMKKFAAFIITASLSCTTALANPTSSVPDLFFEYGDMFDLSLCSNISNKPITNEMVNELNASLPMIKEEWNKNGVELLNATTRLFNVPFSRKELSVNFILCDIPFTGMSYPLIIKLRAFLKSSSAQPLPSFYLTTVIYHELLHRYISNDLPGPDDPSPLLKKYESEGSTVLAHLHLDAIQKYVYHSLNRDEEFEKTVQIQLANAPNPAYKRAWEIVNAEGYMAFVNEILDFLNQSNKNKSKTHFK